MYRTEVGSTISRPASTAILAIDAEDRYTNYEQARQVVPAAQVARRNPYAFTIARSQSSLNGFMTRLAISEIVFPWCIPNINPKTNKIIVKIGGGVPPNQFDIVVPFGFYTPSQLASTLQALIRLQDPTLAAFTMTYGAEGRPSFIYNSNNLAAAVAFDPLSYNSAAYPFPNTTKQLFDLLGFNSLNRDVPLVGGGTSGGGNTFCQAIRYVDLVCTQLTDQASLRDTTTQPISRDMLARIYLNGHTGEQCTVVASSSTFCPIGCAPFTVYKNYALPKQIEWSPEQPVPGVLQFEVFDDAGAPLIESEPEPILDTNPPSFSMTLLITEQ